MAKKQKIEPNIILTIYTHNILSVDFILRTQDGTILKMDSYSYNPLYDTSYKVRHDVINIIEGIFAETQFDTIILESTKIFTDGITKYPDPELYKNVVYSFGMEISIIDNFKTLVDYILVIPYKDWTNVVLNTKLQYLLDKCKNHISLCYELTEEQQKTIYNYNLYTALCLSESVKHTNLLDEKYLIR